MASNKTVVKGIRASKEFFDMCDFFARKQGETRNDFILGCVGNYVQEYLDYDDWLKYKKENKNGNT